MTQFNNRRSLVSTPTVSLWYRGGTSWTDTYSRMPLVRVSRLHSTSTIRFAPSSYGASSICHATHLAIGETLGGLSSPKSAKITSLKSQYIYKRKNQKLRNFKNNFNLHFPIVYQVEVEGRDLPKRSCLNMPNHLPWLAIIATIQKMLGEMTFANHLPVEASSHPTSATVDL